MPAKTLLRPWRDPASRFASGCVFVALMTLVTSAWASEVQTRPNIVIILADDLGFADLGCYGSEIPTPCIDRLARNGLRFTQFYNAARCCPSRACLLTGLYPHQAGVGHMTERGNGPGYLGHLNQHCVTIAEVLGQAGYFTAQVGKWHLGWEKGSRTPDRGFLRSLTATVGGFYFQDSPTARGQLFLDGKPLAPDDPQLPSGWYSTDLWVDYGIRFIAEARTTGKPFFLYLAANAPHFPLQAPAAEIAAFRDTYQQGWDRLRASRLAREIELGLLPAGTPLSPRPGAIQPWADLGPEAHVRFGELMAIYAAAVAHLDTAIGRLVDHLSRTAQLDHTLIFFLSDNGGNAEGGPRGQSRGGPPGSASSRVLAGESWALLENTPLRRFKHFCHEGGISSPLVVHWPARIPAGGLCTQPGHLIDLMATCVEVAGATYPAIRGGEPIPPMEGRSLTPAFTGGLISRTELCWEHEGNAAIRVGDLKLVRKGAKGAWELYDLAKDRTESTDLAADRPQIVEDLSRRWRAWAERTLVVAPAARDGERPDPVNPEDGTD